MKINKVIIGNSQESFIEDRFSNGINIISSDDNNKGKTIVIQSMLYALGNEPIFPSSFEFKNYYHIVEIELENGNIVLACRKSNSFIIYYKGNLSIFDNISEFKYFINNTLYKLPYIIKDGFKKLVDPILFYQLFFVGQDNKNTSNIIKHGYYNKKDFINMLYSYYGIDVINADDTNADVVKEQIKTFKNEKKELQKQNKILKSTLSAIGIASMSNDRLKFEEKLSKVEKLKNNIINLSSKRNNATSRKIKNEITLKELRSLNQTLTTGKLHCLDCKSTNIGYSASDHSYTIDVSSVEIRNQILSSIEDKIAAYMEELDSLTNQINNYQDELKSVLSDEEVSIDSLLMYKSDLVDASKADSKIIKIDNEIKNLESRLVTIKNSSENNQEEKRDLYNKIIKEMNNFYKEIDPVSIIEYKDLFTTKDSVYSGVEETEFYLSKLYSLLSAFNHKFPIVMDYFRGGELSSAKEKIVIDMFSEFNNQIIFTVTLKEEELGKYDNQDIIHHINYTPHTPYKLLSSKYNKQFLDYINKFSLQIN